MKTSAMYLCLLLVGSLTFGCGSRKEAEPTDMTIPDHEHPESTPENPSENSSNEQACEDGEDNDLDGKIDCEDDDCTPYAYCSDVDGDGFTPAEGDCDDGDFLTYPDAPELCGGRDSNCDGKPSDICKSCLDTLENGLSTGDGVYQVEPDAADQPFEVYCDMTTEGGGWTLVFRSTNSGGGAENGFVPQTDNVLQLGALPIQPTTVGMHKLSDKIINSLRSGSVNNDINVRIQVDSQPLGSSWHPSACQFQSIDMLDKNHVCNKSTRNGLNATDWIASKHNSALGRWYVDGELGYIWPLIHIGPTPGGNHHGGNLPNPFCTFYDHRTCPKPSSFEIWVY